MFPLKLEKLHLYGMFAVLLNRLPIKTLYLKYVERLKIIIRWLKVLVYKDSVSKMYILLLPNKFGFSSDELTRLYSPLIGLGSESDPLFTGIFAFVFPEATGDGSNIEINTSSLLVSNIAQIGTQTEGQGNSGDITIKATDSVKVTDDVSNINFSSIILSSVEPDGTGNGGNVFIESSELTISNNAQVGTDTSGQGNTGDTTIRASKFVEINKEIKRPDDPPNGLFAQVDSNEGNGGNLTVETKKLSLKGAGSRISASTFGNGNAGNITLNVKEFFIENGAELQAIAFFEGGDAGNITIEASELVQVEGIFDQNNTDGILGEYGGIFASAIGGTGNGGNLDIINTNKLVVQDFGTISVSNFQTLNSIPPGKGAAGNLEINANSVEVNNGTITAANANGVGGSLTINTDSLSLDNQGKIEAFTTSPQGKDENGNVLKGGVVNLNLDGNLLLRNNSQISARTENSAEGGIININANSVVAFPNQNNDIIANALRGNGGDINITTEALLGLEERKAILGNQTNDIDASSEFGLDGNISISTPDVGLTERIAELPTSTVEAEQTTAKACEASRETTAKNALIVRGKGGIPATPDQPLTSQNLIINGETTSASAIPEPIETSQGKIQLARGIKVTNDGRVILTAYPTNNAGERIPERKINCSQI